MFNKKSVSVEIDGVKLEVVELAFGKAKAIAKLGEDEAAYAVFMQMVRNPDGTPCFASKDQIDELPTSVTRKLGDAIEGLKQVKN